MIVNVDIPPLNKNSLQLHSSVSFWEEIKIYSDHRPLVWPFSLKEPNGKLVRRRLKLEEFDYKIIYKNGIQNSNSDALFQIQINAIKSESVINHTGGINFDVLQYLRNLSENPLDPQENQPKPGTSKKPKDICDSFNNF